MKQIKRKIGIIISKIPQLDKVHSFFLAVNNVIYHWNERMHMIHPGNEDEDKIYYVIRSRSHTEGLLSTYFYVLKSLMWAYGNGYVPYVEFKGSTCQYYVEREIYGCDNAWEYYFSQPSSAENVRIDSKKNVLYSGWTFFDKLHINSVLNREYDKKKFRKAAEQIMIQPYIKKMVDESWIQKFQNKKTLGVFLRGTDYVELRPKGHYMQPAIEDVISKIKEFLEKYDIKQIYVVTEDYNYFTEFQKTFGEMVFSNDENFVRAYTTKDYISTSFEDDPYERGLMYLIRLLLLAKCQYIISSKANGSFFVDMIREQEPIDEYWFDLGKY